MQLKRRKKTIPKKKCDWQKIKKKVAKLQKQHAEKDQQLNEKELMLDKLEKEKSEKQVVDCVQCFSPVTRRQRCDVCNHLAT